MHDNKQKLFELFRRLAIAMGQDVTKERLQIYAEYFCGQDYKSIVDACKWHLESSKWFPAISDICSIIKPVKTETDNSVEMAGEIINAVKMYGYTNECEAKKYLGESVWYVVERFGGWKTICSTPENELSIIRAQLRDISRVAVKNKPLFQDNLIENKKTKSIKDSLNDVIEFDNNWDYAEKKEFTWKKEKN